MAVLRSIGIALLGTFAVPVAGITGIASLISLLLLVFSSRNRSFGLFLFFSASIAICYLAIKALQSIEKRGRLLVESINATSSTIEKTATNGEQVQG